MDVCAHFPENCKLEAQHLRETLRARKGCGGKDEGHWGKSHRKGRFVSELMTQGHLSGKQCSLVLSMRYGVPGFFPHLFDPYIWELFLFPNVPVMFSTFSSSQSSKQQTHWMNRVVMKQHPSWDLLQRWRLSPSFPLNVKVWMCEPQATYPRSPHYLFVAKSCWTLYDPWTAAHQAALSPGVCSNVHALRQWCHPNISSPVASFSLSQHQGLFQWVSSLHKVDKVVELNCLLWMLH